MESFSSAIGSEETFKKKCFLLFAIVNNFSTVVMILLLVFYRITDHIMCSLCLLYLSLLFYLSYTGLFIK